MSSLLDLIVVVADADAERTIETLLEDRRASLKIRGINFAILRADHDAGTFLRSPDLLREYSKTADFALVLLDREGSGKEAVMSADEMEQDLEQRLQRVGWNESNSRVIVLDPELEIWVWSSSPHLKAVMNVSDEQLKVVLEKFPPAGSANKPNHPKEAMHHALKLGRKPFSPCLFQELAAIVSLKNAHERAFLRLRDTLQAWFTLG